MNDHLTKPISTETLLRTVARYAYRRRMRRVSGADTAYIN